MIKKDNKKKKVTQKKKKQKQKDTDANYTLSKGFSRAKKNKDKRNIKRIKKVQVQKTY